MDYFAFFKRIFKNVKCAISAASPNSKVNEKDNKSTILGTGQDGQTSFNSTIEPQLTLVLKYQKHYIWI